MTASNVFVIASTVIFLILSLIWSTKSWVNVLFKATFIFMTLAGIILSLESLGYIVRTH